MTIRIPYRIKEFSSTKDIPVEVADKILTHHIQPMIAVSDALHSWVAVYRGGGYIPRGCLCIDGICGLPGHDFDKKGAVDYTCTENKFDDLIYFILSLTEYSHIGINRESKFVHCGYTSDNQRIILEYKHNSWSQLTVQNNNRL